jgi:(1->4)-alpha-D-glucan 1-alpha-D-glucosylmutase
MPDCYQGTEFWDLSLVDPDNRCPVDYTTRIDALHKNRSPANLLEDWRDGRVKQALLAILLRLRAEKSKAFAGGYQPLQTRGARGEHVLAFARIAEEEALVIATSLRCAQVCNQVPLPAIGFWKDTEILLPRSLYDRAWRNPLDGQNSFHGSVMCADLFAQFPVAVLV